MPFTLAHPAAVLPFRWFAASYTSLCALVIGSMSPDFVYFFRFGVTGAFSHSLPGLFQFCVPASLAAYVAYYLFLRQPLIALLPGAIASRLSPQPDWIPTSMTSAVMILASVLIGAATHIGWDAFTHGNTLVARHVDVLRTPLILYAGKTVPLYNVLQHASSVLGLLMLGACVLRWMRRTPRRYTWPTVTQGARTAVCAAILIAGTGGAVARAMHRPARTFEHFIFNGVVGAMAAMMLALLVYCALWHLRSLQKSLMNR